MYSYNDSQQAIYVFIHHRVINPKMCQIYHSNFFQILYYSIYKDNQEVSEDNKTSISCFFEKRWKIFLLTKHDMSVNYSQPFLVK